MTSTSKEIQNHLFVSSNNFEVECKPTTNHTLSTMRTVSCLVVMFYLCNYYDGTNCLTIFNDHCQAQ